jgi:hypothetical protein
MALRVCAPRASSNTVARVRGVTPDRGAEVLVGFERPASDSAYRRAESTDRPQFGIVLDLLRQKFPGPTAGLLLGICRSPKAFSQGDDDAQSPRDFRRWL